MMDVLQLARLNLGLIVLWEHLIFALESTAEMEFEIQMSNVMTGSSLINKDVQKIVWKL